MVAVKCDCDNGSLLKILLSEARAKRLWVSSETELPTSLQTFAYLKYKKYDFPINSIINFDLERRSS
jgi:hypothetical protein